MAIIDHMSLGVADVPAARDFYVICFPNLGSTVLPRERASPSSDARVEFLLLSPFDGRAASAGNGAHVVFAAPNQEAVTNAHAVGLDAGASDEGAPGVRAAYPMPPEVSS